MVLVWIRVDQPGREAVFVEVPDDALIGHVVDAAIIKVHLKTSPDLVTVKFKREKLENDIPVSQLQTSCRNPLVL